MDDESARVLEVERGEKAKRILSDPYFAEKCAEVRNEVFQGFVNSSLGESGDEKRRTSHALGAALEMILGKLQYDIETANMARLQLEAMRKERQ